MMRSKIALGYLITFIYFIIAGHSLGYCAEGEALVKKVPAKKITSPAKLAEKPLKVDMNKLRQTMPFSHYQSVIARNMFFKKTQPEPALQAKGDIAAFVPQEIIDPFAYKGSVEVGEKRLVAIEIRKIGEVVFVDKGDLIEGYEVMEITGKEIVLFKKGEEEIRLNTIQK